jgi:hypothetical protein
MNAVRDLTPAASALDTPIDARRDLVEHGFRARWYDLALYSPMAGDGLV